jgi:putative ATP-grasp target RiPP
MTTNSQPNRPWGLSRLTPYGTPVMVYGEPVHVDRATQMAVWQTHDGTVVHTAKHRQTVQHKATSTSRSTDSSKAGDTVGDNDSDASDD